jgi:protoheme IX farnesyltransferase
MTLTMLKDYYRLTKPGIVYGNVFTTLASFLYASEWHFPLMLFVATVLGISLVIASAGVWNNWLDQGIDRKMERTKDRALAAGRVRVASALMYGTALGLFGLLLLYLYVNTLTAGLALFGLVYYVAIYGYAKRRSHWSTVVGSVAGAVPIVVGYTAVTNKLDIVASILFLTLALWQMPHFYAIASYRMKEYMAAGIPTLPATRGLYTTKILMVAYIVVYVLVAALLAVLGYAGYLYLAAVLLFGCIWLGLAIQGFRAADDRTWARKVFFMSLIVLVAYSVALAVGAVVA